MATPYQTSIKLETPGVNSLGARDVSDVIRYLNGRKARLSALISGGFMGDNSVVYKPGFIKKSVVTSRRKEAFYHVPIDYDLTVTAVSGLDITVADATIAHTKMMFRSERSNSYGAIDAISGSTLTFVTIGSTTFAPVVGEKLIYTHNLQEENTSTVPTIHKDDDHVENHIRKWRQGLQMSWESMVVEQLAGGKLDERMMMYLKDDCMVNMDRSLFFGSMPSSGYTTSLPTVGVSVGSNKGMYDFATNEFDFSGVLTKEKLINGMAQTFDKTVGREDRKILLTGTKQYGKIIELQNMDNQLQLNNMDVYGVQTPIINSALGRIEIVTHEMFDHVELLDRGFLFIPDKWTYYALKGHDLMARKDIQLPNEHTWKMEFYAQYTILPNDGGISSIKIKGLPH